MKFVEPNKHQRKYISEIFGKIAVYIATIVIIGSYARKYILDDVDKELSLAFLIISTILFLMTIVIGLIALRSIENG